jgi:hypothetical protein
MAWDRELQRLEDALRNLNAQYDAFLYGTNPKPPLEVRKRVEGEIRRLSAAETDSSADRFRFSTLQGRYNALCERWDRLQSEKEAGHRPGIHGHFTRLGGGPAAGPETPPERPNETEPVSVEERDARPGLTEGDRGLFERYIAAKKARGEDVTRLEFARFGERLAREREKLKNRLGDVEIEFDVAERDGAIRLIARPKG